MTILSTRRLTTLLGILLLGSPLLLTAAAAQTAAPPAAAPAKPAAGAAAEVDAAVKDAGALAQAGKIKEAIARLERSRAALDERGQSLLGALYVRDGRAAEALVVLRPLADRKEAEAAVLYNAGRAALMASDVEKGQVYLARSVDRDPASPARRELGLLLSRQGRVVEAYSMLRPWTLRNAQDGDARLVAATLAIALERPLEAAQLLDGLVQSPAVLLLSARVAVELGDGEAALRRLQGVLANHPPAMDPEVRRVAAEAYLLAGQPAKAVEMLAGKAGKVPALVLLLGKAQRQAGNPAAAIATLQPLAAQVPDDPSKLGDPRPAAAMALEYGQLLLATGKAAEAVPMLQKATKLRAEDEAGWDALARALDAAGRAAEATQAREHAQGLAAARSQALAAAGGGGAPAGSNPAAAGQPAVPAYASVAMKLAQDGKLQQAFDVVSQRLQAAPDDELARTLQVRLLLSREQNAAALNAADMAVARFPGSPDFIYLRGAVEMAMHDLAAAERDYRRALQLQPQHLASMSDLAVLLMNQGKNEEAKKLLEQVLALNPQDKTAAANLEQLRKGSR
ncbi:MAG TPA: tetratricopeptide repeat protein [Thermoanaerobaculia bacterium]|jgi:Flp pilus assembly protein TadD|nr:tetratricopeptide repeat protein [Thermoanaerobaculia bacterium]